MQKLAEGYYGNASNWRIAFDSIDNVWVLTHNSKYLGAYVSLAQAKRAYRWAKMGNPLEFYTENGKKVYIFEKNYKNALERIKAGA